jgi:glucokinase
MERQRRGIHADARGATRMTISNAAPGTPHAIGIDIGGTFTKLVAMTPAGVIVARARAATNDASAARMIADIREQIAHLETTIGPAAAIGVACPGLVRREARAVHWMKGRLNALEGLDWTAALERRAMPPGLATGSAAAPIATMAAAPELMRVPVINDAHAALNAEVWLGAGRGCRDLVMLTLGTGVGGAVLTDGNVLIGSTGRGGHLGHMTVNATGDKDIVNTPGSLEDAIGNCTIARRTNGRFTSTDALIAAHLQGDRAASDVWHASVVALAAALASIVNAVDPSRIILGGGITVSAGEALFAPLRACMHDVEWRPDGTPVEIVAAQLGDEAGAIGAAKLAIDSLFSTRSKT